MVSKSRIPTRDSICIYGIYCLFYMHGLFKGAVSTSNLRGSNDDQWVRILEEFEVLTETCGVGRKGGKLTSLLRTGAVQNWCSAQLD
jgi:hypothetical protein